MDNKQRFSLFVAILAVSGLFTTIDAQIFAGESLNMPGTYDGYSNPPTVDALRNPVQSGTGDLVVETTGQRRIKTTIAVPGDVGAGNFDWLFTSGPVGSYYANKWAGVTTVVTDVLQTYTHNAGADNNVTLSAGYYSVNFEDLGYVNTRAIWMYTTNAPVSFAGISASPLGTGGTLAPAGQAITISLTASAAPSPEENVYVRWSTNGFSTSNLATVSFVGTAGTATIPAQAAGTTVDYYVFSTTVTSPGADYDLVTINFENNGGANYSYDVVNPSATTVGNWSNAATWNTAVVPSTGASVTISANVTLDVDAEVSSLTLSSGTLTDGGPANTITIQAGGTLADGAGSYSAGSGTISFPGGGSVSGTVAFNNVTIGGGVNFGAGSTVNNNFTINAGGFVDTNRPAYGASSTLVYSTGGAYGSSLEWEGTTPVNVLVTGSTSLTLNDAADYTCTGDLTIDAGSSLTMSTGIGFDLFVAGDWANNAGAGGFNNGSSAVFLNGSSAQSISGTTTFDFLLINNAAGVTMSGATVNIDDGLTCTAGTLNTAGGTLTLLSDAGGTAWLDNFSGAGNVSGNVVQQRRVTGVGSDFHFLSAPFSGATINGDLSEISPSGSGQIIPTATCDPAATDPLSPYGNVMQLVESGPYPVAGCDQSAWYVVSSGAMTPGRGYACIIPNGTTMDIDGTVPGSPVSYGPLSNTTAEGDGWHLVGNPFPSPINWTSPVGFGAQAQLWQTTGTYTGTFQAIVSGGGQIGSMQGFQVRVPVGSATFTLTNADRTTGDPSFFRSDSWYDQLVELDLSGNGFMDKTAVYFAAGGTPSWDDAHDAHKKPSAHGQPTVYTMSGAELTSINGQGLFDAARSIPLGLRPGADGSFTFDLKTWDGFPATARVLLEDLQTGTWTDLQQTSYTFTMSLLDNPDRFILHLKPGVSISSDAAGCTNDAGAATVDLGDGSIGGPMGWTSYTLRNAIGTTIDAGVPSTTTLDWTGLAAGDYTLTLEAGSFTAEEIISIEATATAESGFELSVLEPSAGESIQLLSTGAGVVDANWDFGDGNTAYGDPNPLHTWSTAGDYTVTQTVYSSDNCSETSTSNITIRSASGIEPSAEEAIKVWSEGLRIWVDAGPDAQGLELLDLSGRQLAQLKGSNQPYTLEAPAPGYFLVRVLRDDQFFLQRLVIQD